MMEKFSRDTDTGAWLDRLERMSPEQLDSLWLHAPTDHVIFTNDALFRRLCSLLLAYEHGSQQFKKAA